MIKKYIISININKYTDKRTCTFICLNVCSCLFYSVFGSLSSDGCVEGVPYRFQEYSSYTVPVCFISEGTTGYSDIAVNYNKL